LRSPLPLLHRALIAAAQSTPDGDCAFLETNPSPMFKGFEKYSGLPLTESLAALLLNEQT
jgi:hypothetical protein